MMALAQAYLAVVWKALIISIITKLGAGTRPVTKKPGAKIPGLIYSAATPDAASRSARHSASASGVLFVDGRAGDFLAGRLSLSLTSPTLPGFWRNPPCAVGEIHRIRRAVLFL